MSCAHLSLFLCLCTPNSFSLSSMTCLDTSLGSVNGSCVWLSVAVQCGSGGGGGGVAFPLCNTGAGFSVTFQTAGMTCSGDAQDDVTGQAANTCNSQCTSSPNYNSCFCPCTSRCRSFEARAPVRCVLGTGVHTVGVSRWVAQGKGSGTIPHLWVRCPA